MTAEADKDGLTPADILVEIYPPGSFDPCIGPGMEGRLRVAPCPDGLDLKVLVVADDLLLRIVLSDALRFAGVGVIEAADAAEAQEVLGERTDIGVVIADVSVAGRVDDLDLAWRCAVEHPDLPVVMMSALIEPNSLEIPPDAMFIQKPFTPDLLVQVVKPLLAAGKAPDTATRPSM